MSHLPLDVSVCHCGAISDGFWRRMGTASMKAIEKGNNKRRVCSQKPMSQNGLPLEMKRISRFEQASLQRKMHSVELQTAECIPTSVAS